MILEGMLAPNCYMQSLEHGHCGSVNLRLSSVSGQRWQASAALVKCLQVEANGQRFTTFVAFIWRLQCCSCLAIISKYRTSI